MWAFTVSWPVGSHKNQWKCRFAKSQLYDSQATRNKTIGAEKNENIVCVPKVDVEETLQSNTGIFPYTVTETGSYVKGKDIET